MYTVQYIRDMLLKIHIHIFLQPVREFLNNYGGYQPSRNRVVVPARQAPLPVGIGFLESILRLLKSLKIRALGSFCFVYPTDEMRVEEVKE
jgi:hypothetical protein